MVSVTRDKSLTSNVERSVINGEFDETTGNVAENPAVDTLRPSTEPVCTSEFYADLVKLSRRFDAQFARVSSSAKLTPPPLGVGSVRATFRFWTKSGNSAGRGDRDRPSPYKWTRGRAARHEMRQLRKDPTPSRMDDVLETRGKSRGSRLIGGYALEREPAPTRLGGRGIERDGRVGSERIAPPQREIPPPPGGDRPTPPSRTWVGGVSEAPAWRPSSTHE
jgi:hypothetical protein